jgi:glucosamine kinase
VSAVAAIDGGKSGLRMRIVDTAGESEGRGSGFVYSGEGADHASIIASVHEARADAGAAQTLDHVVLGLTGVPGEPAERAALAAALERKLAAPVLLLDDAIVAHAGAIAGPGTIVCAGTGTIVLSIDEEGSAKSADGWGPTLGDRGSAYAIGLAGLRAAAAAIDGAQIETALSEGLRRKLGGDVSIAALQRFYRDGSTSTPSVASFAVDVARAAEAGDPVAASILDGAAADLADTIAATAAHAPGHPISYSGRMLAVNTHLRATLDRELRVRGLILSSPLSDALAGGIRIAQERARGERAGLYEKAIRAWEDGLLC